MSDLFMRRTALISACQLYRYFLMRVWAESLPILVVCVLNPSWADEQREDQTLLALIHFARLWGYGGLWIVNLRAYRSSSPAEVNRLAAAGVDVIGPSNEAYLQAAIELAKYAGAPILVAWGNGGVAAGYGRFAGMARDRGGALVCLGTTGFGAPKHPMARGKHRIPRDQRPIAWKAAA